MNREDAELVVAAHKAGLDFARLAAAALDEHEARLVRVDAELAELRLSIAGLSNRLEALTRAVGVGDDRHSRGIGALLAAEPYVVVNLEAAPRAVIGTYLRTVEDTVEYRASSGDVGHAPEDCVAVVTAERAAELVAQGSRS